MTTVRGPGSKPLNFSPTDADLSAKAKDGLTEAKDQLNKATKEAETAKSKFDDAGKVFKNPSNSLPTTVEVLNPNSMFSQHVQKLNVAENELATANAKADNATLDKKESSATYQKTKIAGLVNNLDSAAGTVEQAEKAFTTAKKAADGNYSIATRGAEQRKQYTTAS